MITQGFVNVMLCQLALQLPRFGEHSHLHG